MNNDLELQFHQKMLDVYTNIGRQTGYWARRYKQKVDRDGGLKAAKQWLVPKKNPSQGMEHLKKHNRLDLSFEHLVVQEPWSDLFTAKELQVAHDRLK